LNEILLKNKRCEIEYPDKYWSKISHQAKDIVEKLLNKNPHERISAAEALQHEWFNQDEKEMND
jgi:calcium-dependent protein kinase